MLTESVVLVKCIRVTLAHYIVQVSSMHFCDTSSVCCTVCPPPRVKGSSNTKYLTPLHHTTACFQHSALGPEYLTTAASVLLQHGFKWVNSSLLSGCRLNYAHLLYMQNFHSSPEF